MLVSQIGRVFMFLEQPAFDSRLFFRGCVIDSKKRTLWQLLAVKTRLLLHKPLFINVSWLRMPWNWYETTMESFYIKIYDLPGT